MGFDRALLIEFIAQ
jgi:hypothetical protein